MTEPDDDPDLGSAPAGERPTLFEIPVGGTILAGAKEKALPVRVGPWFGAGASRCAVPG
jgi:hypothetical protein